MQPWMILAALMGLGVATLLVAPTLHRRSIGRAQAEADAKRRARADVMRGEATAQSHRLHSEEEARRVRDALILRGVSSAITHDDDGTVLVVDKEHDAVVASVIETVRSAG